MAEPITMQKLINSSIDSDTLGEFANVDKMVTSRLGSEYPSAPMASRLLVENGLLGATPFSTYAAMTASALGDGDYAIVTNDSDAVKNGVYRKNSTAYEYQKYNPMNRKSADEIGVLVAVTDSQNNYTWLQANDKDGGLTNASEQAIRDKLNVYLKDNSPAFFAITDGNGNLTDLHLDSSGQIPIEVLRSWHDRVNESSDTKSNNFSALSHELPALASSPTSLHASDVHYKNGELLPVTPNLNQFIVIGSSSAMRFKDYAWNALKLLKPSVLLYNQAFGGAVIEQQAAMLGSAPLKIRFANNTINKSGDTAVSVLSDVTFINLMNNMIGWASGVKGKLKLVGSTVYFERAVTAAVNDLLSDSIDFIPEKSNEYRNAIQILWIGKNNLTSENSVVNDVDRLIANTNAMLDYNASLIKRCVIMTHYIDTNTPANSPVRSRINRCNQIYKIMYKQAVFDVNEIILGTQVFTDLGITRTEADISQQALGNMPPSLTVDNQHLTNAVYEYVAQKLADFINSKNFLGV